MSSDMPVPEVIEHLKEAVELQAVKLPQELRQTYRNENLFSLAAEKLGEMHAALVAISNGSEDPVEYAVETLNLVDCREVPV